MLRTMFFAIVGLGLAMSSCSPVVYSTVGQNVPLLKEAGEASFSGGFASSSDNGGVALQAAVAPVNHFALITSYYNLSKKSSGDSWYGHGSYFEVGAGGFESFGAQNNFVFETFAGVGFGHIENRKPGATVSSADLSFIKPFLQPSIGITGRHFEAAFTPRIGLVSYTKSDFSSPDADESAMATQYINDEKNTFVFEPGVTVRGGLNYLKLQVQYNYSTFSPWDPDANGNKPNVHQDFFSIGLVYLVSKRHDK